MAWYARKDSNNDKLAFLTTLWPNVHTRVPGLDVSYMTFITFLVEMYEISDWSNIVYTTVYGSIKQDFV